MMKRFILTVAVCLLGISAFAQVQPGKEIPAQGQQLTISPNEYTQFNLLAEQNKLLKARKTWHTVTVAGVGTSILGLMLGVFADSDAAIILLGYTGALTGAVGSVGCAINQYKLISNQKKINESMMLQLNPNGVVLRF
jgi:hypothetical protein